MRRHSVLRMLLGGFGVALLLAGCGGGERALLKARYGPGAGAVGPRFHSGMEPSTDLQ